MRNINEDTHHAGRDRAHATASDGRLRELMTCLVQHLHAFARESRLTEAEWSEGIRFLTETGQMCSDKRQEFILLSDTLGLSMLVTRSTTGGPRLHRVHGVRPFPCRRRAALRARRGRGQRRERRALLLRGRVCTLDGTPVAGAEVQVWQSDALGFYDVQYEDESEASARIGRAAC